MAERVVHGPCPHDCPDGCAMLVTVDDAGRATHVAGDPEHPITAGFLCGKAMPWPPLEPCLTPSPD